MMARSVRLSAVLLLIGTASAHAQGWSAEAQFGRIRSSLDPAATTARSIAAGLRYETAATQFRVLGGVPTMPGQPYWGAVQGARRFTVHAGRFVAGFDVSGNGFLLRARNDESEPLPDPLDRNRDRTGHALAAQAAPLIGFEHEQIRFHARVGASRYKYEFDDQHRERAAWFGDAQLTYTPVGTMAFMPAIKRVHAADSTHTFASIAGVVSAGPLTMWAQVGEWLAHDSDALAWAAGVAVRVHDRITVNASTRQDAFDPLHLTTPNQSWNLGLSVRAGPVLRARAPVPASYVDGRATIRLPRSQTSARPSVAGDFNGWRPQPMQPGSGGWTYSVAVPPGVYHYSFVNERGEWFVPEEHAGRKEDGMGGYVAVLVVQP